MTPTSDCRVLASELSGSAEIDPIDAYGDEDLFLLGNTLFVVYHELGHALIDLLGLPVVGREEDAVDGFAAVSMIPEKADAMRDALIVAVADGWRVQSDVASEEGERRYWGKHALDEQRHFAVVCQMVGSDQEGFYDYAVEAGLPEERIRTCQSDFESMKSGWKRLLSPYAADTDPIEPSIGLVYDEPLPVQQEIAEIIWKAGMVEEAVFDLGERISLPVPITVRFSVCGEANAYWSRTEREVKVCYELIDQFDAILRDALIR